MGFALTNAERLCLGLAPIEPHWDALSLDDATVYLDGDVLRKLVRGRDDEGPGYLEADGAIRTCDQGTRFAPARKGAQGTLLTLAAVRKRLGAGTAVFWCGYASGAVFAQHIPSSTFVARGEGIRSDEQLRAWVESFVAKAGPSAASRAPMLGSSVRVRSGRR